MPRKPRIFYPGAVYHVILRGNAGQDIFFEDKARKYFYRLLQEGREKFEHRIHAFCLMANHVHLVIQVGDVPLSRIIQNLSQRYTGSVNRRQKRTGHVFQGRYKAILIDAETYLLELVRYIHLNPVRAGIVERVDDYPWTSLQTYLGKEKLSWLNTDWVLGHFGSRKRAAQKRFKEFIQEGLGQGRREEFHKGIKEGGILGDDAFAEEVLTLKGEKRGPRVTIDEILVRVCDRYGIHLQDVIAAGKQHGPSEARAMVSWLVRESPHLSLTELSRRLNREISSLSWAARRLVDKANFNAHLSRKMTQLRIELLK